MWVSTGLHPRGLLGRSTRFLRSGNFLFGELVTSTEKEPQWLCTPPQGKAHLELVGLGEAGLLPTPALLEGKKGRPGRGAPRSNGPTWLQQTPVSREKDQKGLLFPGLLKKPRHGRCLEMSCPWPPPERGSSDREEKGSAPETGSSDFHKER